MFLDEHGGREFGGPDLRGVWNVDDMSLLFGPVSFSAIGPSDQLELPKHEPMRQDWLGEIDQEGWFTSYPYSGDEYHRLYPKSFSKTEEPIKVWHDEIEILVQVYQYVTMGGVDRSAIAARVKFDCLTIRFVSWSKPENSSKQKLSMIKFLQSISLQKSLSSSALVTKACKPNGANPVGLGFPN
ncbi:MAG: hypothetical protein H7X92_13305 [Chitinophagales bacterium]|nr:hypothetical protein [Hyphomicrobiales bacterium]